MSQGTKITLGILTVLPFILLMILLSMVFGFVFGVVGEVTAYGEPDPSVLASNLFPIVILGSGAGILSFALAVYYIVHVMSIKGIDSTVQIVWVLVLLFTSPIGSIVYWFMNIWNDPVVKYNPTPVNTGYTS